MTKFGRSLGRPLVMTAAALALLCPGGASAGTAQWNETYLYNFQGPPKDGEHPMQYGSLVNYDYLIHYFIGTSSYGGKNGVGTIFAYDPDTSKEAIDYSFKTGTGDGQYPMGTLWYQAGKNGITGDVLGVTQGGAPITRERCSTSTQQSRGP